VQAILVLAARPNAIQKYHTRERRHHKRASEELICPVCEARFSEQVLGKWILLSIENGLQPEATCTGQRYYGTKELAGPGSYSPRCYIADGHRHI
jgi:hypothetical protein